MKKTIVLACLLATLTLQAQKEKVEAYIKTYRELAITEMIRTGVPASIKLAQGILESQSGESELARVSNNHFGIKCKTEWTGARTYHDDDAKGECFRVYTSVEDSYKDHSDFLRSRPHYAFLFQLDPTDYEGWANGLKKAGYATSPTYPQKLLKVINEYNLQQYSLEALARQDRPAPVVVTGEPDTRSVSAKEPGKEITIAETPGPIPREKEKNTPEPFAGEEKTETMATATHVKKPVPYPLGIFTINHTKVIYVAEGTSLLSIANQYDISLGKLIEFNELDPMDILDTDRLLFIERKPKKGATDFHVAIAGETLYAISQLEGVRLENLLEYNHLSKNTVPAAGAKIFLRTGGSALSVANPGVPR